MGYRSTLYDKYHRLDNLTVVFGGDILNGRAPRSLIEGLSQFSGNSICIYSPQQFQLDKETVSGLRRKGLNVTLTDKEEELPSDANALYWTRPQAERIKDEKERETLCSVINSRFKLTSDLLDRKYKSKDLIIMHCLPIVGEVSREVGDDPRSVYLDKQMQNGLYTRMALLGLISGRIRS